MRLRLGHMAGFLLFVGIPSVAFAGSCKSVLTPDTVHAFSLNMVTLNGNGVASYANDFMEFHPKGDRQDHPFGDVGWWGNTGWLEPNGTARQLFSDRFSGVGENQQPFAVSQKDLINIAITYEDSPHVTVTLRSWGNVKTTFVGDCSADGIMHGTTPNGSFLLFFFKSTCSGGCG